VRALLSIVGLALSATAVAAQPSFDCSKAATAVETAICADENSDLAVRDRALSRLFSSLKEEGGHDKLLSAQQAWLKQRNGCGGDASCLRRSYDERLAKLSSAAGDEAGVTGTYRYQFSDDTDLGGAFIVRQSDGTLMGKIQTITGPSFHGCDVDFDRAEAFGDAWLWTGAEEDTATPGERCQILFRTDGNTLRIDSRNCNYWCGMAGYFDQTYSRAK
jgi:uncharacterized protein